MIRVNWAVIPGRESHPGIFSQRYEGEGISVVHYRMDGRSGLPLLILADELMVLVQRGRVSFNIGEESVDLKAGDLCRIPARTPYGATCGPEGAEMLMFLGRRKEGQTARQAKGAGAAR